MSADSKFYNWSDVFVADTLTVIVDLRLTDGDGTPRSLHDLIQPISIRTPLPQASMISRNIFIAALII